MGRCVDYRVTIRGDGLVRYEDLAAPPVPQRTRRVSVDEVVALANEFVRASILGGTGQLSWPELLRAPGRPIAVARLKWRGSSHLGPELSAGDPAEIGAPGTRISRLPWQAEGSR